MFRYVACCFIVLLAVQQAIAQCDCGYPSRGKKPCQKCVPEQPRDFGQPREGPPGAYVGPPRSGVEVGEARGFGIEGPRIRLPEINLRLPSIEFPALTRYRRRPRMIIDSAEAPYEERVEREEFGVDVPPGAPRQLPPPEVPRDFPGAPKGPQQGPSCPKCHRQAANCGCAEAQLRQRIEELEGFVQELKEAAGGQLHRTTSQPQYEELRQPPRRVTSSISISRSQAADVDHESPVYRSDSRFADNGTRRTEPEQDWQAGTEQSDDRYAVVYDLRDPAVADAWLARQRTEELEEKVERLERLLTTYVEFQETQRERQPLVSSARDSRRGVNDDSYVVPLSARRPAPASRVRQSSQESDAAGPQYISDFINTVSE